MWYMSHKSTVGIKCVGYILNNECPKRKRMRYKVHDNEESTTRRKDNRFGKKNREFENIRLGTRDGCVRNRRRVSNEENSQKIGLGICSVLFGYRGAGVEVTPCQAMSVSLGKGPKGCRSGREGRAGSTRHRLRRPGNETD